MKFNSIEIKKFNKELAKVEKNLTSFDISKEVENVLHEGGSDIRNTISLSMQQTKRAPWYYQKGRKKHFPSLPGHPPAIDSGELLRSLMFDVNKFQLRVGVFGGAPYAKDLEKKAKGSTDDALKEQAIRQIEIAHAYSKYQELLSKYGMVDFGNQFFLGLKLLREHPLVLKRYQDQFKYILVVTITKGGI